MIAQGSRLDMEAFAAASPRAGKLHKAEGRF